MKIEDLFNAPVAENESNSVSVLNSVLGKLDALPKIQHKEIKFIEKIEGFESLFPRDKYRRPEYDAISSKVLDIKELNKLPIYELVVGLSCTQEMSKDNNFILEVVNNTKHENIISDGFVFI